MAWIESHQELLGHPKTLRLAAELRCSVPTAIGYLHILWWWALDYAPHGLVQNDDKPVVARACQWHGRPERFWQGLVTAGFVEDDENTLKIHDWMDYAGRLLERRAAHVARTLRARGAKQERNERASGASTVPYRTGPNRTVPPPLVPPNHDDSADALVKSADAPESEPGPCCPLFGLTGQTGYARHSDYCPTRVPESAQA